MNTLKLIIALLALLIAAAFLVYLPFWAVQEAGWYGVTAVVLGLGTSYLMLRKTKLINR